MASRVTRYSCHSPASDIGGQRGRKNLLHVVIVLPKEPQPLIGANPQVVRLVDGFLAVRIAGHIGRVRDKRIAVAAAGKRVEIGANRDREVAEHGQVVIANAGAVGVVAVAVEAIAPGRGSARRRVTALPT